MVSTMETKVSSENEFWVLQWKSMEEGVWFGFLP